MNKTIIITFANQKGGVGKTTLCTLFANYLVAKGKSVIVVDCDGQQTIYEKRQADRKKYSDEQVKYNIQAFSIANIDNVRNLMKNLRQMPGVVLIDAPGNLAQQGLIPLFAQTDYIVCPYQYEITSINSTVVFVRFILRLDSGGFFSFSICLTDISLPSQACFWPLTPFLRPCLMMGHSPCVRCSSSSENAS